MSGLSLLSSCVLRAEPDNVWFVQSLGCPLTKGVIRTAPMSRRKESRASESTSLSFATPVIGTHPTVMSDMDIDTHLNPSSPATASSQYTSVRLAPPPRSLSRSLTHRDATPLVSARDGGSDPAPASLLEPIPSTTMDRPRGPHRLLQEATLVPVLALVARLAAQEQRLHADRASSRQLQLDVEHHCEERANIICTLHTLRAARSTFDAAPARDKNRFRATS